MRLGHGGLRRLAHAVSLALVLLGLGTMQVAPAAGHARVVGTDPEDRAQLDVLPHRVTVFLDSKPVTVEGDPLRVYGPTGQRVDAGDVRVVPGATDADPVALSVGLSPDAGQRSGDYEVAYRVVSADAHLVPGRFTFSYEAPAEAGTPATGAPSLRSPRLVHGWPGEPGRWPQVLVAVALGLAVLGVLGQRWRRSRLDRRPVPVGRRIRAEGLVAGRRLD